MIRLPPTTIGLKPRDIKDFERRRKHYRTFGTEAFYDGEPSSSHKLQAPVPSDRFTAEPYLRTLVLMDFESSSLGLKKHDGHPTVEGEAFEEISEDLIDLTVKEGQHSPIATADEFHYVSFLESSTITVEVHNEEAESSKIPPMPMRRTILEASSPFTPDDISTPPNVTESHRLRHRFPPPRSPLYLSQNASSSPEHSLTTGLTPRVISRVATHNTPGIIFATPARRPRKLRHQTNSFSFDSSERASAAYEQERVLSASTDLTTHQETDNTSLHEELRGSSLQSSRDTSGASFSLPPYGSSITSGVPFSLPETDQSYASDGNNEGYNDRSHELSSPQLQLPPPFSTVSRRVSRVGSLPSSLGAERMAVSFATSPPRSLLSTPAKSVADGVETGSSVGGQSIEGELSHSPRLRMSPRAYVQRIISSVRRQSPLNRRRTAERSVSAPNMTSSQVQRRLSAELSPMSMSSFSGTPEQTRHSIEANYNPQTPSRSYQVYNDDESPSMQPQTPANLPEARHQSRYHPSYTAPVVRGAWRRAIGETMNNTDGVETERRNLFPESSISLSSRYSGRPHSPIGLRSEGFQGLYGGRENGDDEQNWTDGVALNNTGTRFVGGRRTTSEERSFRETPEREDWRTESARRTLF